MKVTPNNSQCATSVNKRITGSNFSTIPDEEDLSVTANFTTPQTNEISHELVAIKAKDQEETPHSDPPSIFPSNAPISTPLFFTPSPTEKGEKEITKSQDLIVDSPTVKISGSQLWFDFVFFAPDLVHPTCFKLRKFLSATSLSPTKTKGSTIFVFDPGGIFPFYEFSSATVTISATPPHRSSFIFDLSGIKSDVFRHLSNQTFQKALSSSSVSILVSSSSFSTMVLFFNIPLPTNLVLLDTTCTPNLTDLTIIPQPQEGDMALALAAAIDAAPSHAIAARSGSASGDDWELGFAQNGGEDGRTQGMGLLAWAS